MKKVLFFALLMIVAAGAFSQEEKRVFITGFEDDEEVIGTWSWSGNAFKESFVEYPTSPKPVEGEAVFVVVYDNGGSEWQYATLNFGINPVDISGMREIHMWVYFTPGSDGPYQIRLDLPGGNILGFATAPSVGEWHELVWKIDRKTAVADFMKSINTLYGFIVPTPGSAKGEVWIDKIEAVLPANTPSEFEEILVYGFNEADPATGAPKGWTQAGDNGYMPEMSAGLAAPKEGSDAMAMFCWSGYIQNVRTTNALEAFNRWKDVLEIQFDVLTPTAISGGWMQSRIRLRSGIGDDTSTVVERESKEIGYYDATSAWKTLLWEVDMAPHIPNIQAQGGWFEVRIDTNQNSSADGQIVLVDNFRVTVPKGPVAVNDWCLY